MAGITGLNIVSINLDCPNLVRAIIRVEEKPTFVDCEEGIELNDDNWKGSLVYIHQGIVLIDQIIEDINK